MGRRSDEFDGCVVASGSRKISAGCVCGGK